MSERWPGGGFVGHWLPVLAWMAIIAAGTSWPGPPALAIEGGDKVAHLLAYAVLGGLLMRAFHGGVGLGAGAAALAAIVWGVTYGAYDEVHQAFLASRTCSTADLAADALGVSAAAIIGYIVVRRALNTSRRRR